MKKFYQRFSVVLILVLLLNDIANPYLFHKAYAAEADTQQPSSPTNLTASEVTSYSVKLSWDAATDNVGVESYDVYCNDINIGSTASTNMTYSSLSAETTYTFYVKAKDSAGNASLNSNSIEVTTISGPSANQIPSAPTDLQVIAASGSAISICWLASTDDVGIAGYDVYIDNEITGTVSESSYTASNLTPNTSYNFYVRARDTDGNLSASSSTLTASTTSESVDTQAPSTPSNLSIAGATSSSISLIWNPSSDNVGVKEYEIFCNDISIGKTTETSFIYSGINSTTNSFYVIAYDTAGNASNQSNTVVANLNEIQPLIAPDNLSVTLTTGTAITLSWTDSNSTGVIGYKIYRDGLEIGTSLETNYTDSTVLQDVKYTYTVKAYDKYNNLSVSSNALVATINDTQAPTAPGNVIATVSGSAIIMTWDASTDDTQVAGYKIYRDGSEIGTSKAVSFTDADTSLVIGNTYVYTVRANDTAGNLSDASNGVSVIFTDTLAPTAPANVVAAVSGSAIILTWNASTDNVGVTGYNIYQDSVLIGLTTGEMTYTVADLEVGQVYVFTVRARDDADNVSKSSEEVSVMFSTEMPSITEAKAGEMDVAITWSEVTWAKGYELSINGEIISVGNVTSYVHIPVLPNTLYEYRVRAINGSYLSNWCDSVSVLTAPGKVINLVAKVVDSKTVKLTWDAVDGALAYEVEVNGAVIGTVTDTTYTHSNTSSAQSNTYRVRAVNGELTGVWSEAVINDQVIYIAGETISQNTIWSGGTYIIQGNITVAEGVTLQITSGTVVKFNPGISLTISGTLITNGSEEKPIILTSVKDTEYGGSGVTLGGDYWKGIYIGSTGEFTGDCVKLKYGGYYTSNNTSALNVQGILSLSNSVISGSNQYGINIGSGLDVTIQNCIIEYSRYDNIHINKISSTGSITIKDNIIRNASGSYSGIYIYQAGGSLTIEKNTIENNGGYPIRINMGGVSSSLITQGIASDNIFSGNSTSDSIYLIGTMITDLLLTKNKYTAVGVVIPSGKTLTIQPGSVVLGNGFDGYISVSGKLLAQGTAESHIIFTSSKDIEYGGSGVTNYGDYWRGIYIGSTGEFTGDYVELKYGGYDSSSTDNESILNVQGILSLSNSEVSGSYQYGICIGSELDVTIQNCIIQDSRYDSIRINKTASTGSIKIKDNIIRNSSDFSNYGGINIYQAGGSLIVGGNTIENNRGYGIYIYQKEGSLTIEKNIIKNNGDYPIRINLGGISSSLITQGIASDNIFSGNSISDSILLSGTMVTDLLLTKNKYTVDVVVIPSGKTLTIQPGSVMLGKAGSGYISVFGKLMIQGTEDSPVIMTSTYNPEYGGTGVTSSSNYCVGIKIQSTGELVANYLKLSYAQTGINVLGKVTLVNSEVINSYNYGIYCNTTIQPTILFNSFKNAPYAVYNASTTTIVNAAYNYWDSIYGPCVYIPVKYNQSNNTWTYGWVGSGTKIYGKIICFPYLGSEMTIALHFGQTEGVYAPSGNYSKQFTDMRVNCLESTLDFTRSYNSQDSDESGVLGKGWSFSYEATITDYKGFDNIKLVSLPDGSQESYTVNSDGSYTSNNTRNTLIKQADGAYILTTKAQVKYGFNTKGILIWIESREGNRLTISLNSEDKPQSITDYVGRQYTLTYTDGLLQSIEDPTGRAVHYTYDNKRLIKVIDPEGIAIHYSYNDNGYLTEIRDGNNDQVEAVTYITSDKLTRVDQMTDSYGNVKTYTYDDVNDKTTITDSNGNATTQWYDTTYNITNSTDASGKVTALTYFMDGGVNKYSEASSVTDRNGNTTTYERDNNGNYTKITNPDGSYKSYTYDDKNNMVSERDEAGKYTFYIYDLTGTYLLKVVKPLNGTDTYSASADQNKYAITTYNYYQAGENGYTISGLVKSITDAEGNTITYTYDSYGYIKTVTDSASNTTSFNYNISGFNERTLSPKGETTWYTYDKNGNLRTMTQPGDETTYMVYDALGRKIQELTPNIYKVSQAGDVGYRYTYYKSGKVHTLTDPENNTTSYTYDIYGNVASETKPNGSVYSYEYDFLNRVTKEYYQDSAEVEKVLLKSYTYVILADKKTETTMYTYLTGTDTSTTIYTYDYAGRQVKQVNPDGGIISTVYNANGTIYSTTDAKLQTTYYKYDGLNRLTEQWIPFTSGKYSYKSFSYDKNGNKSEERTGVDSVNLWSIPVTMNSVSYDYDCNNQVISVTDSANGRTEYEYDPNGNVSKKTVYLNDTDTNVTEYEYNHLGKVVTMTQHVEAGDIYGYTYGDTADELLITRYSYDANGNVISMESPDHSITTYEYDNLNRQITQSVQGLDEYGNTATKVTSTTYDFSGNILTVKDANGNITTNEYNKRGLLVRKTQPEGTITAYYYDNAGRVIAEVSPKNYIEGAALSNMNRTIYTYDGMNHILLEQDIYYDDAAGEYKTITSKAYKYDLNGNVIKTLDALGYESGTGATITEKINSGYGTINTYNNANLLITTQSPVSKDKGITYDVSYTYDATGNKISETNANGKVVKYYYDGAGRLTKTTIIDSTEKVLQNTTYDRMGNILTKTDGNGVTTTFTYNRLGLVRSQTSPGDASIDSYTTYNQYNSLGQLVAQKDSLGKVNLFTYNHEGKILSQTEQTEAGTQKVTITNTYDKNGNLRYATDAKGVTTEYTYDGLNRVSQTIIKVGGIDHITTNTYDKNGNQLTTTDWLGNTYTNTYDALNRLISKTDPYGKVIEQYEYNNNHVQTKAYDALGNATAFTYDKNNRLLSTTDPVGNVTSQTYDNLGNIETKTDGLNNVTRFEYDQRNRLAKVTNAKGEITSYTYDLNGNMLTQTDGKGNITTFEYNAANKLIRKIDQGGRTGNAPGYTYDPAKTESYTYYSNDKTKTKTDKNGNVITYTYDVHGNLLTETSGSSVISYTYDNKGNCLTVTDATGTTSRTYDELNRVLTKEVPNIGTITFAYDITAGMDAGCSMETSVDPKGNVTKKVYDKAGRLSEVIAGNDVIAYAYYDNGNRSSVTYSNGAKEEYTYNKNNQVETLINRKPDGSILDSYRYTYDTAGNQLTKYEIINGAEKGTTTYTYDTLNRLSTVTEPNGRVTSYTYDMAGNRLTETVSYNGTVTLNSYTYNSKNCLTDITTKINNVTVEVTSYSYDNNGNQLITTVKTYDNGVIISNIVTSTNTYDYRNQLITTLTQDNKTVENMYNAEGYRTGKKVDGSTTYYLYEADKVILEVDDNGNQEARNVYGTNLLMKTADGVTYYYMYNGHADVTVLLDAGNGTVAGTYYYDAFGNILEHTGVNSNITYSGYQWDPETGLYYLNARMYDPKTARFLQEDTYTGDPNDPLSLNLYTYCSNNPIRYWDPTGHFWKEIADAIGNVNDAIKTVGKRVKGNAIGMANIAKGIFDPTLNWLDLGIGAGLHSFNVIDDQTYKHYKENAWNRLEKFSESPNPFRVITDLAAMGIGEGYLRITNADKKLIDNFTSISKKDYVKSFKGNALSIFQPFQTILDKDKAYNYFLNGNATDEQIEEYATNAFGAGLTLYGGAKLISGIKPQMAPINLNTNIVNLNGGTLGLATSSISFPTLAFEGGLLGSLGLSSAGILGASQFNNMNEGTGKTFPGDYLNQALKRQGLNSVPNKLKETWVEGDYKYEVRIHEAEAKYSKTDSIYRVSRQKVNISAGQQGTGVEYMDTQGNWYNQSVLKETFKDGSLNPNFNEAAARDTHIEVPK